MIDNWEECLTCARNNEMFFSSLGTQYFCTSDWFVSDSMKGHVLNTEGQTVLRNKKNTIIVYGRNFKKANTLYSTNCLKTAQICSRVKEIEQF